ncbi:MAG: superoxide dismutase family protein [Acidobacteria bacterium]|nr:MAG: superoxide dismutase family protein [Acidobacteriota bacterium]
MKAIALVFAAVLAAAAFAAEKPATHGIAVLIPGKDSKVAGTVHFKKEAGGVRVTGTVTGLAAGNHGFHIHEFGDCSAADFTSAGGHFNPAGNPHAGPKDAKRHEGDMGNIEAAAGGSATIDYLDAELGFEGVKSILGRGVIVHANPDDFKTQPTGNAGGRVACGVIGVAKAE